MSTSQEIFESKMNSLADAINTKALLVGKKTVDELKTTVDDIKLIEKTITHNGTYYAINDNARGYSIIVVNTESGMPSVKVDSAFDLNDYYNLHEFTTSVVDITSV